MSGTAPKASLVPRLRSRSRRSDHHLHPVDASAAGAAAGRARTSQRGWRLGVKRIVDRVAAAVLLIVLAPLLAAAAIAIRVTSPGPVLYRSRRIGRFERPITVLKFRSMRVDADDRVHREHIQALLRDARNGEGSGGASGATHEGATAAFKLLDDDRITPMGRVLRMTSLDELPQLINVLRGEMSLVGPRPELPYVLEAYEPWQRRRFDVLPGLTGLWQVSGRDALSPAQMLELDVAYADGWTLRSDVSILLRTLPALADKFRHGTA